MPQYRLHLFKRNGARRAEVSITGRDDGHAVKIVEDHSQGHLMELWEGTRLVKRFDAEAWPRPEAEQAEL